MRRAELLEFRNDGRPGGEFLLEYQRGVLLALERAQLLTAEQLAQCVRKLTPDAGKEGVL